MKYVRQICIIFSISLIAELMEYLIPLPIAASVYGLVLMLTGLVTKLIPLKAVEDAADFFVEIMPILFVPVTVSIMTNVELLKEMLVPLTVISLVTTILVMGITGKTAQAILAGNKRKKASGKTQEGGGTA